MIRLVLPDNDYYNPNINNESKWFAYYGSQLIPSVSRPYLNIGDSYACFVYLNQYIHVWLTDNNIKYTLASNLDDMNITICFIIFENKQDAMLFKLRWF